MVICILREEKVKQRQKAPKAYKAKKGAQVKRKTKQNKRQNKGSWNLIYKYYGHME